MTVDRTLMAELHERFLAELVGGTRSKASGATWKDKADGGGNRLTQEFAFRFDGKSTRGKGITVDRAMLAKIREEAGGERPMIGLRFYDTDDLQVIGEEWVVLTAEDFGELLAEARYRPDEIVVSEAGTHPDITVAQMMPPLPVPPTLAPSPPAFPAPLHGTYPADLPVPPHELWPCLIVDSRHDPDNPAQVTNSGYFINDTGMVSSYGISSCRVEHGTGQADELFVNETRINRGQLYVDGRLRATAGLPAR